LTSVGVVIPTLNEAWNLPSLINDLRRLDPPPTIMVSDGGSVDETVAIAQSAGVLTVDTASGRGPQMNAGAAALDTPWFCFLHGDARLPVRAREDLSRVVQGGGGGPDAAVWRLRIDAEGWRFRTIERGAWLRDRIAGLPYGDQGLLVRRALFVEAGGFPEIPIMEDVALIRKLRRLTGVHRFPSEIKVSARRWEREGAFRTWLRNSLLIAAYSCGVSPHRLARWYPAERYEV